MLGSTTNVNPNVPTLTQREQEVLTNGDLNKKVDDNLEKVIKEAGLGHVEQKKEKGSGTEVGDFMRLFLEQLKHQDPLNPQEGADFLGQLAQFNSVERLVSVEKAISKLANSFQSSRILEATGLIGKQVEVPTNKMRLTSDEQGVGKTISATLHMPEVPKGQQISDVQVVITNSVGEVIDQRSLGPKAPNTKVEFNWNGNNKAPDDPEGHRILDPNTKEPILDGDYKISVSAIVGDKPEPVRTEISTLVDSVAIDQATGGISLNATSIGTVKLSDVEKIFGS